MLLDYPVHDSDLLSLVLKDKPELAAHLGRWMARITEDMGQQQLVGETIALRAAWEGTRAE